MKIQVINPNISKDLCPKCGSTFSKPSFGLPGGCLNPNCENYYKGNNLPVDEKKSNNINVVNKKEQIELDEDLKKIKDNTRESLKLLSQILYDNFYDVSYEFKEEYIDKLKASLRKLDDVDSLLNK